MTPRLLEALLLPPNRERGGGRLGDPPGATTTDLRDRSRWPSTEMYKVLEIQTWVQVLYQKSDLSRSFKVFFKHHT